MVKKTAKKKIASRRTIKKPKPSKKTTKNPTSKTTKKLTTKATPKPTRKATRGFVRTTKQQAEKTITPEATWIVWLDTTGIGVGTPREYQRSKCHATVICNVFDRGKRRERKALQLAVRLAQAMRQSYANYVQQHGQKVPNGEPEPNGEWPHYDDAAQAERIQQWEERAKELM
jgi:hypothetical protein